MTIKVEVRTERPRRRTILREIGPARVDMLTTSVFLIASTHDRKTSFWRLFHFACDALPDEVGPHTKLRVSPFFVSNNNGTHVYSGGAVCFGAAAYRHIVNDKRDPVDVFWSSKMRVLPLWLTNPADPAKRALPLPSPTANRLSWCSRLDSHFTMDNTTWAETAATTLGEAVARLTQR